MSGGLGGKGETIQRAGEDYCLSQGGQAFICESRLSKKSNRRLIDKALLGGKRSEQKAARLPEERI